MAKIVAAAKLAAATVDALAAYASGLDAEQATVMLGGARYERLARAIDKVVAELDRRGYRLVPSQVYGGYNAVRKPAPPAPEQAEVAA